MRLSRLNIRGYRSVSGTLSLHLDHSITVLLGANDHGKTNLLHAAQHLNEDHPFVAERDLNWDHSDDPEHFPVLEFHFALDKADRESLLDLANAEHAREDHIVVTGPPADDPPSNPPAASAGDPKTNPPSKSPASDVQAEPGGDGTQQPSDAPKPPKLFRLEQIPETLVVQRLGVGGNLTCVALPGLPKGIATAFFKPRCPRVEIIKPYDGIIDEVGAAELGDDENEFMRGILYYAGIDARTAAYLFAQDDKTMMELKRASLTLNKTLRANWTQGSDLSFFLTHESKTEKIILRIEDPAVAGRLVRASQRSQGFTHFFALKTVLYARQREHPASSYIFLFDEPGIYLHPSGQYDLLQVLEAIGKTNQLLYSTHSVFMINKTFPARHRLIVKGAKGTTLDGKPFLGRWGAALEALGLSLSGALLFSQHVLLAEGDSDPMLILAAAQRMTAVGLLHLDLNALSVVATENSKNADALIRLLTDGARELKVGILVDGDAAGKARLKALQPLLKAKSIEGKQLDDDSTVEDYLPLVADLYPRAVADYVLKLSETASIKVENADDLRAKFQESFKAKFGDAKSVQGVAAWGQEEGKRLGQLDQPPSKIGISREYVRLLFDAPDKLFTAAAMKRPLKLMEIIQQIVGISDAKDPERAILK